MEVRSILVFVTSDADDALGENVLKLPLLLALERGFPAARIVWIAGTSGNFYLRQELAPLVAGRIAEFITDLAIPKDPLQSLRYRHPVLDRHFDLIIDTQRYLGRTLFLRRIPHRRFISGTWRYFWSNAAPPLPLLRRPPTLVDKLVGLAAAAVGQPVVVKSPIPLPSEFRARAAELLPAGLTYIGLAPGAGSPWISKRWPRERFIALARLQVERGRVPVFLLGPEETGWIEELRSSVPRALFPEQQDGQPGGPCLTPALGERLHTAVANCSGTGHLLAAGGAPMVSLYGPTHPKKYAPFSRALICLRAQDYGSRDMAAIPLDAVAAAVERQIRVGPAAAAPVTAGCEPNGLVGADLGR